jgi:hypothetical protein
MTTTHLHALRRGLLDLHKLLLDHQRDAYEASYGPVASGHAFLQLALHHEQFAWLRALSGMISRIDAALDEAEGELSDAEVRAFVSGARQLLRSGGDGPFETKYREALQRSPEVVMAHAAVVRILDAPAAGRNLR